MCQLKLNVEPTVPEGTHARHAAPGGRVCVPNRPLSRVTAGGCARVHHAILAGGGFAAASGCAYVCTDDPLSRVAQGGVHRPTMRDTRGGVHGFLPVQYADSYLTIIII